MEVMRVEGGGDGEEGGCGWTRRIVRTGANRGGTDRRG